MDGYKEIYYKLFNRITDIINELETIQQDAEEMFLSQKRCWQAEKTDPGTKNND